MSKLNEGCVYYEHSQTSGSPDTLTRVADGRLHISRFITNRPLDFGIDADRYDKFRHLIEVELRKE